MYFRKQLGLHDSHVHIFIEFRRLLKKLSIWPRLRGKILEINTLQF